MLNPLPFHSISSLDSCSCTPGVSRSIFDAPRHCSWDHNYLNLLHLSLLTWYTQLRADQITCKHFISCIGYAKIGGSAQSHCSWDHNYLNLLENSQKLSLPRSHLQCVRFIPWLSENVVRWSAGKEINQFKRSMLAWFFCNVSYSNIVV